MTTDNAPPAGGGMSGGTNGGMHGARRGRWIWVLSAMGTAAVFIAAVMTAVHVPVPEMRVSGGPFAGGRGPWLRTSVQTVSFPRPVTALDVNSYGADVEVSATRTGGAQVTEIMRYNGRRPPVEQSDVSGRLTLADPACNGGGCNVAFQVTVPAGTTARLQSGGGAVVVSGLSRPVAVDSGGGPLTALSLSGGLDAHTAGGALSVRGGSGTLTAGTGGGPADAEGTAAGTATVRTGGGAITLVFASVPGHLRADSGGGPVLVRLPAGRYAVRADSGGGPQQIGVATDPASPDTVSVSSGGGSVSIR